MNISYWFALGSALAFSIATQVFTHYARKVSVIWMNCFKATVALIAFGIAVLISQGFTQLPEGRSFWLFALSGLIGLNIGDLFLVKAFKSIGAARTLVIFSFQPIFLGLFAFVLFGQVVTTSKLFGILFMIACVFTLSYERFKKESKWDFKGPIFALVGVLLDSCGVLLTRAAFDGDSSITVLEGNFYRCLGACLGFLVMSRFVKIDLLPVFRKLKPKSRSIVLAGGVLGTFVSLWLYLTAISIGNLATLSAIIGTGPVFAAIIEAFISRQWPSRYLYYAFLLFGCGFYLVL